MAATGCIKSRDLEQPALSKVEESEPTANGNGGGVANPFGAVLVVSIDFNRSILVLSAHLAPLFVAPVRGISGKHVYPNPIAAEYDNGEPNK